MPNVTFQRGDVREVDVTGSGSLERVLTLTSFIDGVKSIDLEFPEETDVAAAEEHCRWEMRRRGLIPRG